MTASSRLLLTASVTAARVENDTSGNTRLLKRNNNVGRDDVAAALTLAAGETERRGQQKAGSTLSVGLVGVNPGINRKQWERARGKAKERDGWKCTVDGCGSMR